MAVARGMTRASFGMPDTSRAARYILKDYVNAKLLFAHPPPGIDVDEFMSTSRKRTIDEINLSYDMGRKRAPQTHVSKNADTFVAPAGEVERHRQLTTTSVRANADTAPARSGRYKAEALDGVFFADAGPAPRPVINGRQAREQQDGGAGSGGPGYSRNTMYPHQRLLGPDGMPIGGVDMGIKTTGKANKRHFKVKEGKKRSGKGYD